MAQGLKVARVCSKFYAAKARIEVSIAPLSFATNKVLDISYSASTQLFFAT